MIGGYVGGNSRSNELEFFKEYRYVKSLLLRSITSVYKETLFNLLRIVRVSEPEPPGTGGIMLEPAHIFTY